MADRSPTTAVELDEQSWKLLTDAVRGLECAWQQTPRPDLDPYLPSEPEWLRVMILVELIKVDQEFRWQTGEQCLLETYLKRWSEVAEDETTVRELLEAECLTRASLGKSPTIDELQARFPQFAGQIDVAQIEADAKRDGESTPQSRQESALLPMSAESHQELTPEPHTDQTPTQRSSAKSDTSEEPLPGTIQTRISLPAGAAGMRFGRYEIRALIGRGGMGLVYRAYDPNLSREIALKIPQFERSVEPVAAERFLREARTAAAVRHPHIDRTARSELFAVWAPVNRVDYMATVTDLLLQVSLGIPN